MAALDDLVHLAAINAFEEAEILTGNVHGRRFHACDDPLADLSDTQFRKLYRLTKPMTEDLIELVEPYIVAPTRISSLTISRKVLTSLRFFASGSYQLGIGGNVNHAISQASVSKSTPEVTEALNRPDFFDRFIRLPRNVDELRHMRDSFYENHQFSGVIGCVDCTHVAIFPPQINNDLYPENVYVNRKGYHSINVQLICDTNLRIMNVCPRYPGSTHDSYIWNNSNVLQYMRNLHLNGYRSFYFLGDSGYALRPWMLTPIGIALPNTPEAAYNERHRSTRSLIERCNGVLKTRFRCLLKHRVLHYAPTKASHIINSCTVLPNMCIDNNMCYIIINVEIGDEEEDQNVDVDYGIYEEAIGELDNPAGGNRVVPELLAGRRLQQFVVRNHFTN